MALFLRAVEQADGSWVCRRGRYDLDNHRYLHAALEHLQRLASGLGTSTRLFVHRRDGSIERIPGPIAPEPE